MKKDHAMFLISAIVAVVAIIAMVFIMVFIWIDLRGEIAKMDRLVLSREPAREPEAQSLPPLILDESTTYTETQGLLLRKEKGFWIAVPIQNTSTTNFRTAHRVRVTITFSPDNPIKEIKADPFEVVGGGKGSHSTILELSVLYPQSVIYLSFLVDKSEIPQIEIDWAEKR